MMRTKVHIIIGFPNFPNIMSQKLGDFIQFHSLFSAGHVFKSLNTTGLIPRQGKMLADRIDGIW